MRTLISSFVLLCAIIMAISATTLPTTSPTTVPSTAPVAWMPTVVVRDTDAKTPTTQAVVNGGYVSVLPKHWSLQFNFAATQPASMSFTMDGAQAHVEHYIPWVCEGDDVPINLAQGDHVLTWAVADQTPQAFAVSVLPPPIFGENLSGISYPQGDTSVHPQLLTAAKALSLGGVRLWIEGSFTTQQPLSYFRISRQWQTAGYKVIAVANFQNSTPRCSAPTDAIWTSYWTNFPTPTQTGIYAISIGNEINTPAYCTGSVAAMAHLMQLAYPILHAKGYVVIGGSDLNDLNYDQQLSNLGAFAWCDRVDVHAYYSTVPQVITAIDQGIAFGRSIHKPCDATEFGVRMSASNLPACAAAHAQLLAALKTRTGFLFPFSFYPMESLDQACPLTAKYEQDAVFYPAFSNVLGGK